MPQEAFAEKAREPACTETRDMNYDSDEHRDRGLGTGVDWDRD